jgi:tRNA-specific 2-thiouridylase
LSPAELVDAESGQVVGSVPSVQTVTIGQRRGLGLATDGRRRYALEVDLEGAKVFVGPIDSAWTSNLEIERLTWVDDPLEVGDRLIAQVSSHGRPMPSQFMGDAVRFDAPIRLVSPGQTVAFYDAADPEIVVGSAIVVRSVPVTLGVG